MDDLRQEFLAEAILKLEGLQVKLQTGRISENLEREVFRILHTLKGTSQTFDLNASGKTAHEIENLLQAKRENQLPDQTFAPLLKEGIDVLLKTFLTARDAKETVFPTDFVEKLRGFLPPAFLASGFEELSGIIPSNLLAQLSAQEKEALASALARGNSFYLIEAGFDYADFADKFKELRQNLSDCGEVVATFPSPKFAVRNQIGFQIFFVSLEHNSVIFGILEPFGAALEFQQTQKTRPSNLQGVLAQSVLSGEKTAQLLGKQIEFEVINGDVELSPRRLNLVSEILLHLVRNAVDHAIEMRGKIKIELLERDGILTLRVSDDGRGIDAEKIRVQAIERKLITADEDLTEAQLLRLIFAHGFSTSQKVSEISGRGVGLDVVEDAVTRAGGEIGVTTLKGHGTTFEIQLETEDRAVGIN